MKTLVTILLTAAVTWLLTVSVIRPASELSARHLPQPIRTPMRTAAGRPTLKSPAPTALTWESFSKLMVSL
jgi:hypothetical protein